MNSSVKLLSAISKRILYCSRISKCEMWIEMLKWCVYPSWGIGHRLIVQPRISMENSKCWTPNYFLRNCLIVLQLLLLSLTGNVECVGVGGSIGQMSPRVVHTKQTHFQGFLGPVGSVPVRSGYHSNNSFTFPYNYRGYGHGLPVIEVSDWIPAAVCHVSVPCLYSVCFCFRNS